MQEARRMLLLPMRLRHNSTAVPNVALAEAIFPRMAQLRTVKRRMLLPTALQRKARAARSAIRKVIRKRLTFMLRMIAGLGMKHVIPVIILTIPGSMAASTVLLAGHISGGWRAGLHADLALAASSLKLQTQI